MAEGRVPPRVLADREIAERLRAELPGWTHEGQAIRRRYDTDGWLTTLALVNAIGFLAEAAGHHPDLEVAWGTVRVALRTHDASGVTERDLALARRIEEVALWRPGPGERLEGPSRPWVRGGREGGTPG